MQENDLVSIVMPLFNSEKYMRSSIESVLGQTHQAWELLIVDDCSTDRSLAIAREFAENEPRIVITPLAENQGSAVARNTALRIAKGKYVAFLDSDDIWFPTKLQTQISFMKSHKVHFAYSDYEVINERSDVLGCRTSGPRVNYNQLLTGNVIGCLTAIYDREYVGNCEMPDTRMRQDFGLWLSILKKVDYAYNCQVVLAQYRVHQNSLTSNKIKASVYTWQLYRDVEKIPFFKRVYVFARYAIRGIRQRH